MVRILLHIFPYLPEAMSDADRGGLDLLLLGRLTFDNSFETWKESHAIHLA